MITIEYNNTFLLDDKKRIYLSNIGIPIQPLVYINTVNRPVEDSQVVTAEQLIDVLPHATYIDKDPCHINIGSMIVNDKFEYVVSYDRNGDNWTCVSFSGEKLVDALYDAVIYCCERGLMPHQIILNTVEKVCSEREECNVQNLHDYLYGKPETGCSEIKDNHEETLEEICENYILEAKSGNNAVETTDQADYTITSSNNDLVTEFYTLAK